MATRRTFIGGSLATGATGLHAGAKAQTAAGGFPDRPVRIVVPYAAGGPSDVVTRMVAEGMSSFLGRPVIVENKAGANGRIGMEYVARQPGDGYTLVMFSQGGSVLNTAGRENLSYDLLRDFRAVGNMALLPQLVVTSNSIPPKTLQEFVAHAKANPGKLSYGSSGVGGTPHLIGEWFKIIAGIEMTHVPYRGTGPATTDLIAGRIHFLFTEVPVLIEHVREAKIRALAVSTQERSPLLPDVLTVAESGFPQLTGTNWFGLEVPSATPDEVVKVLNDALVKSLERPATRDALIALGAYPDPAPAERFDRFVRDELARWRDVMKTTGARLD
ncbi:Bug family tripartite tricarboxylate transporter substrate binding protein [Siccirubricoccus phaeus]|uniref:Bug family tripartite tricarboxylate transporter substrate binding protein n=1 Tax=Siccirubricoccus phaeus TaxID=2595053 RepID=UPI00165C95B2|nr:tripartite tricarboxylate transporter substrate binding protein [Siccirubricoccus phaeus]